MNKLSKKSLNEQDKQDAIDSLRLLIKGVPIKDESGEIIGFIERPDLGAIKYVLENSNDSEFS